MRFCVRRVYVCAGEEKRILRKGAFCGRDVTKKRIPYRIDHVERAFA